MAAIKPQMQVICRLWDRNRPGWTLIARLRAIKAGTQLAGMHLQIGRGSARVSRIGIRLRSRLPHLKAGGGDHPRAAAAERSP